MLQFGKIPPLAHAPSSIRPTRPLDFAINLVIVLSAVTDIYIDWPFQTCFGDRLAEEML